MSSAGPGTSGAADLAIAASNAPASRTLRASGPAVSRLAAIGMMPPVVDDAGRRFDADDPVDARRRDDGPVGLCADRQRRETGGRCDGGAARGAGRAVIEPVRVPGLSAEAAPAVDRAGRAEVRPLGQVGRADQDGAGGSQAGDHGCIAGGTVARESP